MRFDAGVYDVAVIGAGHAGIEAGLAAARLGTKTVVFTINLDSIGNCACNPSIGGTAKGHLVREIDALGGEMGKAADACTIQSRMLNRGKGPAVHSIRTQIDRREYSRIMKQKLETQHGLHLKQAEIIDLYQAEDGWAVVTRTGAVYHTKTAIIATGTFLNGRIYVGELNYESGPDGMHSAGFLSEPLHRLGLPLRRFKTGTPARVSANSIDFSRMEEQFGDEQVVPFSFDTEVPPKNLVQCHITWTNDKTKQVILDNLSRSPLYAGQIEGIGPRYCPSIEDKVVRFPDKERHHIFIEPCGTDTRELYLQGMSSSLPEEVQLLFYRTIQGLENVEIMRTAYAIEYDCIDPLCLDASLEVKGFPGLYGAGQFNGSSGYEEAAAQGLVAGINAARSTQGKPPYIPTRDTSYIGVLIDDLVTKGCSDPYRMMTSRSEYRLVLRQDNADERLTPIGYEIGLVSEVRWERFQTLLSQKKAELDRLRKTIIHPSEQLTELFVSRETSPLTSPTRLIELIRRPELNYACLAPFDTERPDLPEVVFEKVEVEVKYAGYIQKQQAMIGEMKRLEERVLPPDFDYSSLDCLRLEAREKLNKVKPRNIGQASRISGVTPADISVLLIWLSREKGN